MDLSRRGKQGLEHLSYHRILGHWITHTKRLERMGIETIEQLAKANPDLLRSRMGIIGEQLYHHANGIDRTIISEPAPQTRDKSYGNSQVLNRNYYLQDEIEIVVKEMAEQVAARIRRHHCQTSCVSIYIGVAFEKHKKGSHDR